MQINSNILKNFSNSITFDKYWKNAIDPIIYVYLTAFLY